MNDQDPLHETNPFLALNKHKFPVKPGAVKTVAPAPVPKQPQVPEDDDTSLFQAALGHVQPIARGQRAAKPVPLEKHNPAPSVQATAPKEAVAPKKTQPPAVKAPQAPPSEQTHANAEDGSPDLLHLAFKDVRPLGGKGRMVNPELPPLPQAAPQRHDPMQDFMDGKIEFALQHTTEYISAYVHGLDLITVGKLQAGHYSPEAHTDLHGMNALQAFDSLVGFLKASYYKGHRTVLVVTGRGLNSPSGMPVLRGLVQSWLTQEPLKRVVLAFCTALPSAGGAGALYLLLRKYRKGKGKVAWERRPSDVELLP